MSDKYDPDRMNADDIDPADHDAVMQYLNHPNTEQLHEDLGRAFRSAPAAAQRPVIEQEVGRLEAELAQLTRWLDTGDYAADERAALEQLREALRGHLDSARLRLLELDDE